MLNQWIRIFTSDNGVLTDVSLKSQNSSESFVVPEVSGQDYVYIGQYFPFNNFHIDLDVVNDQSASMNIEYWGSRDWQNAVDILDDSKVSGVSLSRDAVVQFSPDRERTWSIITDTSNNQSASELTSIDLYNLYWMRFSFDADINVLTAIKSIQYAFTNDSMLSAIDPEIDNYLTAWGGSSKTNWLEQIKFASQLVVSELKSRQMIIHSGNILRFDDVSVATAYRTLMVIYQQLGEGFINKFNHARDEFEKQLSQKRFTFDQNDDALVSRGEIQSTVGKLVR